MTPHEKKSPGLVDSAKGRMPGISTEQIPSTANGHPSAGQRAAEELAAEQGVRSSDADDEPLTPQAEAAVDALLAAVAPQRGIGTSPSDPKPPPAPERMLRFFKYEHLPAHLQGASKPFCDLARWLCTSQPASPERTKSLNALVEAKDWAVRALVSE